MYIQYYVPLEAARLLKEKGYDELADAAWDGFFEEFKACTFGALRNSDYPDDLELFSAPSKAEVIDWLEQKHGIRIEVRMWHCKVKGDPMEIKDTDEYAWRWFYAICIGDDINPILDEESESSEFLKLFDSRLEAENAAIIRALKEITKK